MTGLKNQMSFSSDLFIESQSPLSEITADRGSAAASTVSRREALRIALAASALLVVASCGMLRRSQSGVDKAFMTLRETLDAIATDAGQERQLLAIAEQIETACRDLIDEYDAFIEQFEGHARQRDTGSSALQQVVDGFAVERTKQRNHLLELQDELRSELTEQEWSMVVEALNQTQDGDTRPESRTG